VTCTRELALLLGWNTLSSPIDGLSTPMHQLENFDPVLRHSRQPIMKTLPSPIERIPLRLSSIPAYTVKKCNGPIDDHCRFFYHAVLADHDGPASCENGCFWVNDRAFANRNIPSKVGILADQRGGMRRDARWPVCVSL